jgi:hypothetical protein
MYLHVTGFALEHLIFFLLNFIKGIVLSGPELFTNCTILFLLALEVA